MKKFIEIFRWTLRVLSILFVVFFLLMFIGDTFFQPESSNREPMSTDSIIQLSLMGIGFIGLGLAWKWEFAGGIIALAAYIGLAVIFPDTREFPLLLIYPATAVLFIVLWAISNNTIQKKE
ncbi:MAG: hypothetical protein QNK30_03160 [Bacteroidales bacterium]|nr:hypothetical protein [Bacteroidales bacterium]